MLRRWKSVSSSQSFLECFFPVLLEALFNLNGTDTKEISSTVLKAGLLICILIANYLVFEWRKNKLKERQLNYLNWIFLATIASYGCVFLFLAFVANGNISALHGFTEFFYGFMLIGSMYIPVISIAIVLLQFLGSEIKTMREDIRNQVKKTNV